MMRNCNTITNHSAKAFADYSNADLRRYRELQVSSRDSIRLLFRDVRLHVLFRRHLQEGFFPNKQASDSGTILGAEEVLGISARCEGSSSGLRVMP